jgi:hypothetical protein
MQSWHRLGSAPPETLMPECVPIRTLHRATCDLAEIVSGLLELDPKDEEQWHALFTNLDQRVPRSPATCEVIARLARAIDALASDEEAEAMRLGPRSEASSDQTPARVNVTWVTPLGEEVDSTW